MAAYTIVLHGAADCVSVTPKFTFTAGTVKVEVEDVYIDDLTSGVEHAAILLAEGEKLEYICSSWDDVTRIDMIGDKVSDDISGWVLPASLIYLYISQTSVSGDISGWVLPASLIAIYIYTTSLSGDISGWVLPANLITLYVYSTSIDYDSAVGAFTGVTDSLTKIDFDNCVLTWQQVDNVLADLVASGIDNGVSPKTINIASTNSAPSIIGLSKVTVLEARGWTVSVTAGMNNILSCGLSRTGQHLSSFPEN